MFTYPGIGIIYADAQYVFNTSFIPQILRRRGRYTCLSYVLETNLFISPSLCFSAYVELMLLLRTAHLDSCALQSAQQDINIYLLIKRECFCISTLVNSIVMYFSHWEADQPKSVCLKWNLRSEFLETTYPKDWRFVFVSTYHLLCNCLHA